MQKTGVLVTAGIAGFLFVALLILMVATPEGREVLPGFIVFPAVVAMYMAPTIIAILRSHKNAIAIAITNFFFGWTILGWFIALIWSCLYGQKIPQSY